MKKRGKHSPGKGSPVVRLPLPKKSETRHGDPTKYDRRKMKARLRRETREERSGSERS